MERTIYDPTPEQWEGFKDMIAEATFELDDPVDIDGVASDMCNDINRGLYNGIVDIFNCTRFWNTVFDHIEYEGEPDVH